MMYRVNFKDDSVVFTATEESKTPNFSSLYDLTISNLGAIEVYRKNHQDYEKEYEIMYSDKRKSNVIFTYGLRNIDKIKEFFRR